MTTAEYGLSKAARSFNSRLDKSKLVEAGLTPLPTWQDLYSLAEEGLGLHRIAKRLHDEKILKPCYYKKEMFGRFVDDEKMYDWDMGI